MNARHPIERLGDELKACVQTHQDTCDGLRHTLLRTAPESDESIYEPQNLRVLDVETMMVIPAPGKQYVALSYVWEPSRTAMVKKGYADADGQTKLHGTASHPIKTCELPKTIADVIKVCKLIDQKYLWVDSLCINQIEEEDKIQQISQMDRIYSHAFVTIVAATASDPALGIPNLDQEVAEEASLEDSLTGSLWSSRGWTYQELVLSRRLLIFTSKGMHFLCAKVNHLSQWELPSSSNYSSCWRLYNQAIGFYTQRNLSQKENTLDAFSGVLRAFARYTDDTMLSGLPARQLFYAILWHPLSVAERQTAWPSWSWAGWTGAGQSLCQVNIPSQEAVQSQWNEYSRGRRFFSTLQNLRFCTESGVEVPIDLLPDDESLNQILTGGGRSSYSERTFPTLAPDRHYYECGWLKLKTSTIFLSIVPDSEDEHPKVSEDAPRLKRYRLMLDETWVGTIFLNPDSNDAYPDTSGPCEFILVARFTAYIKDLGTWHFDGLLPASEAAPRQGGLETTERYPAVFPAEHFQAAKVEHERRFKAWQRGEYHCKRGYINEGRWNLPFNQRFNQLGYNGSGWGRENLLFNRPSFDDPHRGMPYPPEVDALHVMWIGREQDKIFRKAIGVIIQDVPVREAEEFRLG